MAVETFALPVCDSCNRPWLPSVPEARKNIREFARKQAEKGKTVRCGHCKTPYWDSKYQKALKDGTIKPEGPTVVTDVTHVEGPKVPAEAYEYAENLQKTAQFLSGGGSPKKLCIHRVVNCKICTN